MLHDRGDPVNPSQVKKANGCPEQLISQIELLTLTASYVAFIPVTKVYSSWLELTCLGAVVRSGMGVILPCVFIRGEIFRVAWKWPGVTFPL